MWKATSYLFTVILSGLPISANLAAQDVPEVFASEAKRHGFRAVVSPAPGLICQTLHDRFLNIGEALGYDRLSRSVFAGKAVQSMAVGLSAGEVSDFVNITTVSEYAGITPQGREPRYFPTAALLGEAIGLGSVPLLITSTDDLKYLPFQQMHTEILIVASSAKELNKSRAERVAALAANLNIHIHTIWTGDEPSALHADAASPLAWLAAATGGRFVSFAPGTCLNRS